MTPTAFLTRIVDPGLVLLAELGGPAVSDTARRMLVAIALQESGPQLVARYQNSPAAAPGPARGFYQFERAGGVAGVLQHSASREWARRVCEACTVIPADAAVWRAMEGHDILATCFARLLLWTDPRALPATQDTAWEYYLRNWRPGRPHPNAWAGNWTTADIAVNASPFQPGTPPVQSETAATQPGAPEIVYDDVTIVVSVPRSHPVLVKRGGDSTSV